VFQNRPYVAGVAEMPFPRLLFELVDHFDGQAQGGGCHWLRLHPMAGPHLCAGVVGVVVHRDMGGLREPGVI
jgi:hypothetical protein